MKKASFFAILLLLCISLVSFCDTKSRTVQCAPKIIIKKPAPAVTNNIEKSFSPLNNILTI